MSSNAARIRSSEKICIVGNERPITNHYNSRHSSKNHNSRPTLNATILIEEYHDRYSSNVPRIATGRHERVYSSALRPDALNSSGLDHQLNLSSNNAHTRTNHLSFHSVDILDRSRSQIRGSSIGETQGALRLQLTNQTRQKTCNAIPYPQALKLKGHKFFKP